MPLLRSLFSRSYESNIPKFFLSHALYNFMLFLPIWVIFLQQKHHLTLTQITFIDFAFWITMAFTEVPTGAVADTIGRKHSMFIGVTLSIVAILLFALAPTYPLLLFANCLWPVAITFISGADMAFFYDSLRVLGRESDYPRLRGRVLVLEIASAGVSSVLGGVLTLWHPAAPFVGYTGVLVLVLVVTFSLKEPPREPDAESGLHLNYRETLKQAYGVIRKHKTLRWAIVYSSLLPLAAAAINITFIQPHAVAIGVPMAALGVVTLGVNLIRMAGSGKFRADGGTIGRTRLVGSGGRDDGGGRNRPGSGQPFGRVGDFWAGRVRLGGVSSVDRDADPASNAGRGAGNDVVGG